MIKGSVMVKTHVFIVYHFLKFKRLKSQKSRMTVRPALVKLVELSAPAKLGKSGIPHPKMAKAALGQYALASGGRPEMSPVLS